MQPVDDTAPQPLALTNSLRRPVVLGAGPVGRAVVARLADRGLTPTAITRSGTKVDGATAARADITDPQALAATLGELGADAVFQCAMPAYHRWPQEFPALQASVLAACADTGAVLVAAENLYGHGTPGVPITEQSPLEPTTNKGRVRADLWRALATAHAEGRANAVAVRASDFFGPGVVVSAYGDACFGALARNKKAQILGDPSTRHSITYVPDYAEALVRVAERPDTWGRACLAPTAPARTQAEYVQLAARHLGVDPGIRSIGTFAMRVAGLFNRGAREIVEMMSEFTADYLVDSTFSETALDQAPTPLEAAIAATADSYR